MSIYEELKRSNPNYVCGSKSIKTCDQCPTFINHENCPFKKGAMEVK
jgi:hypothetical protein